MKDPATEDKVRLKYPYVASELLSLELEVIYGTILRSEDLSKLLFDFLRCVSSLQRVPSRPLPFAHTAPSGRTACATPCSAATSPRQNP